MNLSWHRPLNDYGKVQRLMTRLKRGRRAFVPSLSSDIYLNVGCGPNITPSFVTLDYYWLPGIDICWDITQELPISDRIVRGIFSEHCIEHIHFHEFVNLAREFHRVMKPSALLRIVVPDGEIYLDRYFEQRAGGSAVMPYADEDEIAGLYTPMMSLNRIMRAHGHRFIYDFATMAAVLADAGFTSIEKRAYKQGSDPRLLLDTERRAVESLYVEAVRP